MLVWDVPGGFAALDVHEVREPVCEQVAFYRLFERVRLDAFAVLLDSAAEGSRFSRHSVIAIDPEAVLVAWGAQPAAADVAEIELHTWGETRAGAAAEVRRYRGAPFDELERMLAERHMPRELRAQLPAGFAAGAIGFAGYDAGRFLERLPTQAARDLIVPELCFLFLDSVLVLEHETGALRCIANARGRDSDEARVRCAARMQQLRERFDFACPDSLRRQAMNPASDAGERELDVSELERGCSAHTNGSGKDEEHAPRPSANGPERVPRAQRADLSLGQDESHAAPAAEQASPELRANFDATGYAEMVRAVQAQIVAGNVFEVNVSQRLEAPFSGERDGVWALYTALRAESPAAFACCLLTPWACLLSSSPERFLQLTADGWAESRPIKGTRPRGDTPEADSRLRDELAGSEKDRAENIMIVDLVRNDLGRVCVVDSIHVPELMIVEDHPSVFQLVSTVRGRVEEGTSPVQLFKACFPPGSMTGAPKIEAMKVIDTLEPCRRGIYAGAVGYFDLGGALDFSVVIRSFVISGDRCTFSVGGAVVADSDPESEYRESMDKARALIAALQKT